MVFGEGNAICWASVCSFSKPSPVTPAAPAPDSSTAPQERLCRYEQGNPRAFEEIDKIIVAIRRFANDR